MRRMLIQALLAAALVAAFSVPATPQGVGMTLLLFKQVDVGSPSATTYGWRDYCRGIFISNDSGSDVAVLFGDGEPDPATGEGGGILKAGEGAWFPVRCLRLAMKCAEGSANVRIWVYGP